MKLRLFTQHSAKQSYGANTEQPIKRKSIGFEPCGKHFRQLLKEMNDFKLNCPSINKVNYEVVFAKFVKSFKSVTDKHAPLMHASRKHASRKQRRLQSKPWLTKGLLVSIKRELQLYRSHFLSVDSAKNKFYKMYSKKLQRLKSKAKGNFSLINFQKVLRIFAKHGQLGGSKIFLTK